ncbi:hypothetical protein POM88_013435 [Heracleum sosnowskyi]|uniref:DNA-directed RNA polymerase n=1 Tax=Heracleum sosnowskyi TaxID=360622 RepID=A0AAD8IZZ7_9APIA|nr:hypothetical protein POM88_013435 [Heracleum sosnowskyi]
MTYRGHLMAITRHGINRNDTGQMMRCSFEETVDILLDAAVYAETDYLRGVTENIMLGQLAPIGTGDCSLYLNEKMLQQAIDIQLPSYMEGLDFGMTPARLPISGTPYHDGMMSPNYMLSPNLRLSPITDAQFSPYVGGMGFSPASSPSYSPQSPGYRPVSPGYSPASPGYSPSSPAPPPPATAPPPQATAPPPPATAPPLPATAPPPLPTAPHNLPTARPLRPTAPHHLLTAPPLRPTARPLPHTAQAPLPTAPPHLHTAQHPHLVPLLLPTVPPHQATVPHLLATAPHLQATTLHLQSTALPWLIPQAVQDYHRPACTARHPPVTAQRHLHILLHLHPIPLQVQHIAPAVPIILVLAQTIVQVHHRYFQVLGTRRVHLDIHHLQPASILRGATKRATRKMGSEDFRVCCSTYY